MIRIKNSIITMLVIFQMLTFSSCTKKEVKKENVQVKKHVNVTNKDTYGQTRKPSNKNKKESNNKKYNLMDYCPFEKDLKMTYKGTGNEYAGKELYVDFISNNKMQIRENNGGTETAKVLEIKNGELRVVISKQEFYYRDNLIKFLREGKIDSSDIQNDVILKAPIEVGTKWNSYNGKERKITGVDVNVEIPYGKFKAVEVTTFDKGFTIKDYYVANVGHVKSVYEAKDTVVTTTLMKKEQNNPLKQTIKLYYPKYYVKENNEGLVYKNENINLKTNGEIKDIFEKYFKYSYNDKDIMNIMSEDTKINYVYLDDDEKKVCIDFSKEFVTKMNAGTSKESLIIQAVTNTLGDYYNVDKVYISLDGAPYESGHILLNKNESFRVEHDNAKEMK